MSDESSVLQGLLDQISRLGARDLVSSFIIKFLIAELAATNRSPAEANQFIAGLRANLENFSRAVNSGGAEVDKKWEEEMLAYVGTLMAGISFDQVDK